MGIESKHAYRFGYLKSEKWKAVKLEALVREKAKCEICGVESIFNDGHHVWYPANVWDTTSSKLVILCRPCHDLFHRLFPKYKARSRKQGREAWIEFRNAIAGWRRTHLSLFGSSDGLKVVDPKLLREELSKVKAELEKVKKQLAEVHSQS